MFRAVHVLSLVPNLKTDSFPIYETKSYSYIAGTVRVDTHFPMLLSFFCLCISLTQLSFLHTASYLLLHEKNQEDRKCPNICWVSWSYFSLLSFLVFLSIKLQRPLRQLLQVGQLPSNELSCPFAHSHLPRTSCPLFSSQVMHVPLSTVPTNQLASGSHTLWRLSVPTDVSPLVVCGACLERADQLGMIVAEEEDAAFFGNSAPEDLGFPSCKWLVSGLLGYS